MDGNATSFYGTPNDTGFQKWIQNLWKKGQHIDPEDHWLELDRLCLPSPTDELADGLGRLRSDADPVVDPIQCQNQFLLLAAGRWVIVADLFDESAVPRRPGLRDHHPIKTQVFSSLTL